MKQYYLLLIPLFVVFLSFTNPPTSVVDEVINGMKTGNSALIAKYFDSNIEITLPQKSNSYSRSQAELILNDFFTNNGVKGFEIIHKGENAGSQYCIGLLSSKNGTYRATFFIKQKGSSLVLQELRFENR